MKNPPDWKFDPGVCFRYQQGVHRKHQAVAKACAFRKAQPTFGYVSISKVAQRWITPQARFFDTLSRDGDGDGVLADAVVAVPEHVPLGLHRL